MLFKKKKKEAAENEDDKEEEDAKPAKGKKPEGEEGDAPAEGEEGAEATKKSKKKLFIIIGVAVVLIFGGIGGAYFAGLFGKHAEKTDEEAAVGEDGKPIVPKTVYYTMPEFLVNLNTGGKQSSFLKTTIILELSKVTDVVIVEANLPRLVDSMNTYLRELRSSDLAGSAGIQRLREELLLRANKALAPLKVNDVLFKEIVIQ